jgi:adenosylmethionine-8-amino-7-oxononanoate aminotransferase
LFVSPDIGLDADIICIGKGLGVGYAAMSAVLVADDVTTAMPESRNLMGHNYNGHPLAVAVARQVLSRLRAPGMSARLNVLGQTVAAQLAELAAQVPWVGDVRVAGLLSSVDLVADGATRRPWDPARRVAERVSGAAFEEGLLVLAGSGNIDGVVGDHVTLAPAFVADEADIVEMVARLRRAIERVCAEVDGEFDA